MKTTSYEISKKLKEIGFQAKSEKDWVIDEEDDKPVIRQSITHINVGFLVCRSYDLETLLEALPKYINDTKDYLHIGWRSDLSSKVQWMIGYVNDELESYTISTIQEPLNKPTESFADIVARLLILLHEKGLINFD